MIRERPPRPLGRGPASVRGVQWDQEIAELPPELRALAQVAAGACRQAHALYSHFRVGAALRTVEGEVFDATNVENGSYGLTSCAERNAVFKAVARKGTGMRFDLLALVARSRKLHS